MYNIYLSVSYSTNSYVFLSIVLEFTWQSRIVHFRIHSCPSHICFTQIKSSGIEHKIILPATTIPKLVCESWQYILPRQLWTNASWHQYELRKCISSLSSRSCVELSWLKSIKVCSDIMVQDMLYNILKEMRKNKMTLTHSALCCIRRSAYSNVLMLLWRQHGIAMRANCCITTTV